MAEPCGRMDCTGLDRCKHFDICSVCGRTFQLRKDGRLRHHGDGYTFPPKRCPGAGRSPRGESGEDR